MRFASLVALVLVASACASSRSAAVLPGARPASAASAASAASSAPASAPVSGADASDASLLCAPRPAAAKIEDGQAPACAALTAAMRAAEGNERLRALLALVHCEEANGRIVSAHTLAAQGSWLTMVDAVRNEDEHRRAEAPDRAAVDALSRKEKALERRLAHVRFQVIGPAPDVLAIDSDPVPSGTLATSYLVDPGHHTFTASSQAGAMSASFDVAAGQTHTLRVALTPTAARQPLPSHAFVCRLAAAGNGPTAATCGEERAAALRTTKSEDAHSLGACLERAGLVAAANAAYSEATQRWTFDRRGGHPVATMTSRYAMTVAAPGRSDAPYSTDESDAFLALMADVTRTRHD